MNIHDIIFEVLTRRHIIFSSLIPIVESHQNHVFAVDEKYILKFKQSNSLLFRESQALEWIKTYMPNIPKRVFFESNQFWDFLLLHRIAWKPLDSQWHSWSKDQQAHAVKDLSMFLKQLHCVPVPANTYREVWFQKEYTHTSYSLLLKDVFLDGLEKLTSNPFVSQEDKQKLQALFFQDFDVFSDSKPSLVHHDFWYKNILVDSQGVTGIIDFEFYGCVPVQVELFLLLIHKHSAKNYIDESGTVYQEIEFLNHLIAWLTQEYPSLMQSFKPRECFVYCLCKYVSLLSRWQESWYSHDQVMKFYDFCFEMLNYVWLKND